MIDYIDSYKKYLISQNKYSSYTIDIYRQHVSKFILWFSFTYKSNELSSIDSNIISRYQRFLKAEKCYSDSGVRIRIFSILSFCNFLHKSGVTNNYIVLDVIPLNHIDITSNILKDNEVSVFKNEVYKNNNLRDIAIIELLLNTGIQYNELLALRKEDIQITENYSAIILNTKRNLRSISLNSVAKNALLLYLKTLKEDETLWIGKTGALTRDGINKMIKRYAKKAGLSDKISPSSLIQYFASKLAIKSNLDAKTFASILGYKSTNIINKCIEPNQINLQELLEKIYA